MCVVVSDGEWRAKLVSALKDARIVVDEKEIDAALKSGYKIVTFNDGKSPLTIDVILSEEKLKKKAGSVLGLPTFYQTPEELILAKLRMIKVTVPHERVLKDKEDVMAILRFTKVDLKAVRGKAEKECTISILDEMMEGDE